MGRLTFDISDALSLPLLRRPIHRSSKIRPDFQRVQNEFGRNIIFSSPHKVHQKKIVEFLVEEQEEGCVFHNWRLT